jgi:two-component system phosphate regulon sensor histidine kinase PhoR
LKTPLTTVLGLSELIENGMAKKEDVADFAGRISAQTRRLIDIISDIIKLSEFDEGLRDKGAREVFDIRGLAESVVASLSGKAVEKNVKIELTGENARISADKLMLDELLYNLIDNAIKYNVEGGGVSVDLSVENGFCVIGVTDTGIGIPPEHQRRVFERFYRVDKSRSKKTGGTGLGLSIVKHIAEEHGGGAELESEVGKGTTVRCRINMFP